VIYHLLPRQDGEKRCLEGEVAAPGGDGFVHCCEERQVGPVRERWFPPEVAVVALGFDPTTLACRPSLVTRLAGESERFPHVYGPLRADDVLAVLDL
jgi:uncharacterized protein (DUF952 family)